MYFCCTYILILLEFKDKFFFLGESVYRYDIVILYCAGIFSFFIGILC